MQNIGGNDGCTFCVPIASGPIDTNRGRRSDLDTGTKASRIKVYFVKTDSRTRKKYDK
jgi:hypothetical protein